MPKLQSRNDNAPFQRLRDAGRITGLSESYLRADCKNGRGQDGLKTERIALSVSEAAAVLGVSRPTVYQLMRRKDFPAFQIGKRRLISRVALERWVQAQTEGVSEV